ncbi:translation initiation factor IF-1 [Candidatus Microgenomates bacterium]|nr:translation initiation factor IF-1 [Candidatus Microgenomates bacterium]
MDDKQNTIIEGEVREALPNTMFKVVFDDGREVLTTLSGRMRKNYVRVFPGDRVRVEMTPYDDKRGRIVYKI